MTEEDLRSFHKKKALIGTHAMKQHSQSGGVGAGPGSGWHQRSTTAAAQQPVSGQTSPTAASAAAATSSATASPKVSPQKAPLPPHPLPPPPLPPPPPPSSSEKQQQVGALASSMNTSSSMMLKNTTASATHDNKQPPITIPVPKLDLQRPLPPDHLASTSSSSLDDPPPLPPSGAAVMSVKMPTATTIERAMFLSPLQAGLVSSSVGGAGLHRPPPTAISVPAASPRSTAPAPGPSPAPVPGVPLSPMAAKSPTVRSPTKGLSARSNKSPDDDPVVALLGNAFHQQQQAAHHHEQHPSAEEAAAQLLGYPSPRSPQRGSGSGSSSAGADASSKQQKGFMQKLANASQKAKEALKNAGATSGIR